MVGCGATGTCVASLLARAGVGHLKIIDRDYVEPSNLQRQSLFDEAMPQTPCPRLWLPPARSQHSIQRWRSALKWLTLRRKTLNHC